jgi:hypothetical protein
MLLGAFLALSFVLSSPVLRGDDYVPTRPWSSREIIRGFNAATFATRDQSRIWEWNSKLRYALDVGAKNHTNSSCFLLGAKFGFSFRAAELDQNSVAASDYDLRAVAIQGALARLGFEQSKKLLRITDANLIRILGIDRAAFIAWKTSVYTSDRDGSVVRTEQWLSL